jgi:hypothetical protein
VPTNNDFFSQAAKSVDSNDWRFVIGGQQFGDCQLKTATTNCIFAAYVQTNFDQSYHGWCGATKALFQRTI